MDDAQKPLIDEEEDTGEEVIGGAKKPTSNIGDFITRVYMIICLQLTLNTVVNVIACSYKPIEDYFANSSFDFYFSCAGVTIVFVCMSFFRQWSLKPPYNYILLTWFTINEAELVGVLCTYRPFAILIAMIMALTVTISLTIYAHFARENFTASLALPIAVFSIVFVFAICMRLFHEAGPFEIVICTFVMMMFSVYIVIDVQMLVAGGIYGITYDDHVAGALFIYIDIINLVLSCVAMSKSCID